MKKLTAILLSLAWLMISAMLNAQTVYPIRTINAQVSYDYLNPHKTYTDWKTLELRYANRFSRVTEVDITAGGSIRDENFGWLQAAAYQDWSKKFYTYTSLGTASSTMWMGRFRIDNDLNYKMGEKLQYIATAGQTVILYAHDKVDLLFSLGGTAYLPHTIFEGRYFISHTDPGDTGLDRVKVWSNTLHLGMGFGTQKKIWTTMGVTSGKQSFLGVVSQSIADQTANSADISQQIWLEPTKGVKWGVGFLHVQNGYDKTGINLGYFQQLP